MGDKYILEGKQTVECNDLITWARWFETGNRRVAEDIISGVRISTIFLGLDHAFRGGPPMLFETMVFGGALNEEQERCTTWDQAEQMHKNMVERVKKPLDPQEVK